MAYLNFNAIFEFLWQFPTCIDAYIIFQKGVDNFEMEHNTCSFLVRHVESLSFASSVSTVDLWNIHVLWYVFFLFACTEFCTNLISQKHWFSLKCTILSSQTFWWIKVFTFLKNWTSYSFMSFCKISDCFYQGIFLRKRSLGRKKPARSIKTINYTITINNPYFILISDTSACISVKKIIK